jgi:predicted  nucleic acid-binding Zn-ribbon protein
MAPVPNQANDMQFLLSDLNTRIRDTEERNKITKDRALVLGKNLIETRNELTTELQELKTHTNKLDTEIQKLKKVSQALILETGKYVKREEIILVERMLKDFQPLQFARMTDIDKIIEEKMSKHK